MDALLSFGEALHTVTDRASPWHDNHNETWYGWLNPAASAGHAAGEYTLGPSREVERGMAEHEAYLLWERYQKMLKEKREKEEEKRRREEEEKKKKEAK